MSNAELQALAPGTPVSVRHAYTIRDTGFIASVKPHGAFVIGDSYYDDTKHTEFFLPADITLLERSD